MLLGAQVSYAAQNIRNYLQQRASERIDQQGRELIACRAVLLACHRFLRGLRPPTVEELAESINAPPQWLNQLLFRLIEGGLLCEVADEQLGLVPARPPDSITIADVLDVVRTGSGIRGATTGGHDGELVKTLLGELSAAQHAAPANLRFSDLAAQLDAANT